MALVVNRRWRGGIGQRQRQLPEGADDDPVSPRRSSRGRPRIRLGNAGPSLSSPGRGPTSPGALFGSCKARGREWVTATYASRPLL